MQIIAYTESADFKTLLEVECTEISGQKPHITQTPEELIDLLNVLQTVDFLIVQLPDDSTRVRELKLFFAEASDRLKRVFVLGGESGTQQHIRTFAHAEMSALFEETRKLFGPSAAGASVAWTSVPVCALVHFSSVPFDLFIKLSERKFIKRIHKHEEIAKDLITALQEKGIQELYCEKIFNRDFSMMLINNMINRVDRPYATVSEEIHARNEVFETTREIIQNLGLTGRVVEVCDATVEGMCQDVLKEPDQFSAYLTALKNDKSLEFQFKLINLTNYIGSQLILDMGLPQADEQVKKFVFASYFSDMMIKNPIFVHYRRAEELLRLPQEEQNEVYYHAVKASELVTTYRDLPKEVALIIRQHHGSLTGLGFPSEKPSELHPLAKILFVAQDLSHSILTNAETPALDILKGFLRKNKASGLSELVKCLESSLLAKRAAA